MSEYMIAGAILAAGCIAPWVASYAGINAAMKTDASKSRFRRAMLLCAVYMAGVFSCVVYAFLLYCCR